jgi:hypothetical protein
MKLICRCGTIYEVCQMPMDVFEVIKKINAAKCPACDMSGKRACVYVENLDEKRHEAGRD